jgi:hypothetical protein
MGSASGWSYPEPPEPPPKEEDDGGYGCFMLCVWAIGVGIAEALWNWLAPNFHAPTLTYWQTAGLILLIAILRSASLK